jgi:hypothetical protein
MRLYEDTVFYDDALICGEAGMEYKSTKPRKLKPQITCMLSPNPAKDYSMINFSTNPTSSVTITISDIQGRVIKSEQVTISDNQYRVNTAHWIEGIYLIRVVHENLVIFDGKLKINPSN